MEVGYFLQILFFSFINFLSCIVREIKNDADATRSHVGRRQHIKKNKSVGIFINWLPHGGCCKTSLNDHGADRLSTVNPLLSPPPLPPYSQMITCIN